MAQAGERISLLLQARGPLATGALAAGRTCDSFVDSQPPHLKLIVLRFAMAIRPQTSQVCTR